MKSGMPGDACNVVLSVRDHSSPPDPPLPPSPFYTPAEDSAQMPSRSVRHISSELFILLEQQGHG